eukprot:TRINITY_DN22404_c0_g1_i1.p1 TRINITY_DN22404_c0_g1~~TRINITY_DN22404_c0_g1_i1.p1  ORF type:complete len:367 (+),score=77.51 TRINITY_DN22404_c0_g1_i1:84-1103(+)
MGAGADEYVLKMMLIGNSGVGKTHLLHRFARGVPHHGPLPPTVGAEFGSGSVQVGASTVQLQVWDMAGAEKNRVGQCAADRRPLYQHAVIFALVYDAANAASFAALDSWFAELPDPESAVLVVVANHSQGGLARVSDAAGEEWAAGHGAAFHPLRRAADVADLFSGAAAAVLQRLQEAAVAPEGPSSPAAKPPPRPTPSSAPEPAAGPEAAPEADPDRAGSEPQPLVPRRASALSASGQGDAPPPALARSLKTAAPPVRRASSASSAAARGASEGPARCTPKGPRLPSPDAPPLRPSPPAEERPEAAPAAQAAPPQLKEPGELPKGQKKGCACHCCAVQ